MDNPLGQPTRYVDSYDPSRLHPMPRAASREPLGLSGPLPFDGEDVWHGYELSWLDATGKPCVGGLRLRVPATSPHMVESKSVKLYLNGFSQTAFADSAMLRETLQRDLAAAVGAPVGLEILTLEALPPAADELPGECIDSRPLLAPRYRRDPALLGPDRQRRSQLSRVEETLHSHLFRSLCPVTGQPDWASVVVRYAGPPMDRDGLLAYLVSYRQHQAFHEVTIEQIFVDVKDRCGCERLTVAGFFLRRGGLDISPWRSDESPAAPAWRLRRQ